MPSKQHLVKLSLEERSGLEKLSCSNRASIREKTRARVLLLSDLNCPRQQGGYRRDAEIAEELGCTPLTVSNIRQRAGQRGVLQSIKRGQQHTRKARKLDGRQESAGGGSDLFDAARGSLPLEFALVARAFDRDGSGRADRAGNHSQHA